MMLPEKPKRNPRSRSRRRTILAGLLLIPLFFSAFLQQRLEAAQALDVLLIGFMLCCILYIVYQSSLELLFVMLSSDDDTINGGKS